eukprot:1732513-Pyramimonas_sp.AAC.1
MKDRSWGHGRDFQVPRIEKSGRRVSERVPPGFPRRPPRPPEHPSRGPEGPRGSKLAQKIGGTLGQ